MKKALIITTISGFVPQFEMNNVHILQDLGYEVHYASNFHTPVYDNNNNRIKGTGIICHQIDFVRSPYYIRRNSIALMQLISLMRKEHFHLVHCHTPMGGVLGRIAAHKTNTKPVIYTAHGFHFYKGAPIWNWLFFYPVERFLARWTDCLITINEEDYKRAQKFKLQTPGTVKYVPGIGIDIQKYQNIKINRHELRKQLNIPEDAFLMISVGELTKRKNHEVVIKALSKCQFNNIYYIICGSGILKNKLQNLIKKSNLDNRVYLLGYRKDIPELLNCCDCFIFPSRQEGLPVALMEASIMGLPTICSNIRGNKELSYYTYSNMVLKNHYKYYKKAIEEYYLLFLKNKLPKNIKGAYNFPFLSSNVKRKFKKIYSNRG